MRPISLDTTYDALTIVIDQCENELEAQDSFFKRELNAVFESKKLIYYKDNQMSADEFFKDVARKVKSHEAMLPASKRMVICNYLDAYKLSHDWLQGYRERMDKFRSMVAIRTGFDQYYITFVRYQADNPIGEVRDEVYEVLQQLWNIEEQLPMEHAEFLLYAGGFDSLETHEKGMVRFLQLLGMKDYWKVYDYASFEKALYLLAYEDYYEKRAQICQSEIQKINDWMNQAKDPDMLNFEMISREALTSMLQRYTDEMVKFKRLSGLYPVSITEYTSHGFGPFRTYTRSSQKHASWIKKKRDIRKVTWICWKVLKKKKNYFRNYRVILIIQISRHMLLK